MGVRRWQVMAGGGSAATTESGEAEAAGEAIT